MTIEDIKADRGTKRIARRHGQVTREFADNLRASERRKLTLTAILNGLRLDYWRYSWRKLWEAEDFRRRLHFFKIIGDTDRIMAAGEFDEWGCAPGYCASLERFVQACDTDSQTAYEMGWAAFKAFCRDERNHKHNVLDYGSVALFHRLCIESNNATESATAWRLIDKLVNRFASRDVSMMILKAFPLEYEGKLTNENRAAFERRRRAMLRLLPLQPAPWQRHM